MFIILSWLDFPDVSLVLNEDGKARVFPTHAEAERFAESELAFNWKIIEL
jgi:hypothetical protein